MQSNNVRSIDSKNKTHKPTAVRVFKLIIIFQHKCRAVFFFLSVFLFSFLSFFTLFLTGVRVFLDDRRLCCAVCERCQMLIMDHLFQNSREMIARAKCMKQIHQLMIKRNAKAKRRLYETANRSRGDRKSWRRERSERKEEEKKKLTKSTTRKFYFHKSIK